MVEASDASVPNFISPNFPDGTIYTNKVASGSFFTCSDILPSTCEINIKIHQITVDGLVIIGVSNKKFKTSPYYLGQIEGEIGFGSNNFISVNGVSYQEEGFGYKSGDIFTLRVEDGEVTYAVNDRWYEAKFNGFSFRSFWKRLIACSYTLKFKSPKACSKFSLWCVINKLFFKGHTRI